MAKANMPKKMRPRRRIKAVPEAVEASYTARWLWHFAKSEVTFTVATVAFYARREPEEFADDVVWFVREKWIELVPNQSTEVFMGRI